MKKIFALLAVISAPGLVHAAGFQNGSFEAGTLYATGSFDTLGTGSTAITGWTVTGGNIDYIGGLWQAAQGSRSLDMVGNSLGSIAQSFDTTAGAQYKVEFALSSNIAGGLGQKILRVIAGNESDDYTYSPTGLNANNNMRWADNSFTFTADAATTLLSFQAINGLCCYGAALDNVRVTQVAAPIPEPETYAMMLAGLGLLGFAGRRRKVQASA
jgi:choice-of-anchor C domain-containing protein